MTDSNSQDQSIKVENLKGETPLTDEDQFPPLRCGSFIVGYVEEIHGKGGKMQPVTISRNEVKMLVQSYITDLADTATSSELDGVCGSEENRMIYYGTRRVNALVNEGLISQGEVDTMWAEAISFLDKCRKYDQGESTPPL